MSIFPKPLAPEYRELLERDFALFLQEAVKVLRIKLQWSPHYDVICQHLMALDAGTIQAQNPKIIGGIINIPPRTLKSVIMDCFEVWRMLKDPTAKSMHLSYGEQLMLEHSSIRRDLVRSRWFRRNWPHIQIKEGGDVKNKFDFVGGGQLFGSTVGGAITGFGGTLIVLDDPLKAEDAYSEHFRTRVNRWYHQTLISRFNDASGYFVIISQRLHEEDLVGYVLEEEQDSWIKLIFPLECEKDTTYNLPITGETWTRKKGDVLLPVLFPPHKVERLKKSPVWDSQYQQRPHNEEGSHFKRVLLEKCYYDPAKMPAFDLEIVSVDCSFKAGPKSDFVSVQVWGIKPPYRFMKDKMTFRGDVAATVAAIAQMKAKHPNVSLCLIEQAANGFAVTEVIRTQGVLPVYPVKPQGGKDGRAIAMANEVSAGHVLLPDPAKIEWVKDFVDMLCHWNGEGSIKFDDDLDAASQLITYSQPFCATGDASPAAWFDSKLTEEEQGLREARGESTLRNECNLCPVCKKPLVTMSGFTRCPNPDCRVSQVQGNPGRSGVITIESGFPRSGW